jgi:hypothetical protein
MSKKKQETKEQESKEQLITINGTDYNVNDLTDTQKAMVNHVYDLRSKISNAKFGLEQLQFAEVSFSKELVASLDSDTKVEEVETEEV